MKPNFWDGFASGAGLPNRTELDFRIIREKWLAWSSQLTDLERKNEEEKGWSAGFREGRMYADHHTEN